MNGAPELAEIEPVPGHQHVHFARWGDRAVVVKQGQWSERLREARAITALGGALAQPVLLDTERQRLIIDRVLPGEDLRPLARLDDDAATSVIGHIIQECRDHQSMSAAPTEDLPDLGSVVQPVENCDEVRLPGALRAIAMRLCGDLLQSSHRVVVHGDLQHRNVLRRGDAVDRQWVAIDPHGWLGDPAFDAAPLLAAPESLMLAHAQREELHDARGIDPAPLVAATARRIDIIAEITGDDPHRLWAWAFVGAVIAEARLLHLHGLVHGAPLALARGITQARYI